VGPILCFKREMRQKLHDLLELGYGHPIKTREVATHVSKSQTLPILDVRDGDFPVEVFNFSYNYHFHYLGLHVRPLGHMPGIPATFLEPISSMFGPFALSGHVEHGDCPPLTNFERAYHTREGLRFVGMDVGSSGINAAFVIRYLLHLYTLDRRAIFDLAMDATRIGARDFIDGNYVNVLDLCQAVGLKLKAGKPEPYGFDAKVEGLFSMVKVRTFDFAYGGSCVEVEMGDRMLIPSLPTRPSKIRVDPRDTILAQYVPAELLADPGSYGKSPFEKTIPLSGLSDVMGRDLLLDNSPYPLSNIYRVANSLTRNFTITCPNVLDAALTAAFLIHAVTPVVTAVQEKAALAISKEKG